jgi:hypothetical protein
MISLYNFFIARCVKGAWYDFFAEGNILKFAAFFILQSHLDKIFYSMPNND